MRPYWMFSLAIGGGAALVVLALLLGGALESVTSALAEFYASKQWSPGLARFRWLEIALVLLSPLAAAAATVGASRWWQKWVAGIVLLALVALLSPTLALYGILFDPFPAMLAGGLAWGGGLLFARTARGRRQRLLEGALGRRVSASVLEEMLAAPGEPEFSGSRREVTTLVCRLEPSEGARDEGREAEVLAMGSLFLRTVTAFLLSRGAYLEEAGPGRVRASFGMLRDGEDHAVQACRAALDLRGRLLALARECEARWFRSPGWGIGIGTGSMVVGLCGTPGDFFLSGVGGEADFADRLALANFRYRSDLLLGPGTYGLVRGGFEVRPLEMLYDPESRSLREVYQLLGTGESVTGEEKVRRDCFWRGVIHFRAGEWESALEQFSRARVPGAEDPVLARLISITQDGVAAPESRPMRLVRELTGEGHARPLSQL